MTLVMSVLLAALTTVITPPVRIDSAKPQTAVEKMPIFLQTNAPDAVGATYVARLREALEKSPSYRTALTSADAQFVVGIVTMDPNEAEPASGIGRSTVAAVTLYRENTTGHNQFVYSWVLVARRDKVDRLVSELIAAIDKEIQGIEGPPVRVLDNAPSGVR